MMQQRIDASSDQMPNHLLQVACPLCTGFTWNPAAEASVKQAVALPGVRGWGAKLRGSGWRKFPGGVWGRSPQKLKRSHQFCT